MDTFNKLMLGAVMAATALTTIPALAESADVKVAANIGIGYLPFLIMEDQGLFEKHALAAGLENPSIEFVIMSGASAMNDALLSGAVQYSTPAVPALAILWDRTKGTPQEVRAVTALNDQPIFLNMRSDSINTIEDLSENDRIALPTPTISIHAITLQMAAAELYGPDEYQRLDPLTVTLPHGAARDAIMSGGGEVNGHLATQPFAAQELKDPAIRTVLTSYEVLGGPATVNVVAATSKFREENPEVNRAFIAALEEAIQIIEADKSAAVEVYARLAQDTTPLDELLAMLEDERAPITFSIEPHGVMQQVDFMHGVGIIESKPDAWQDLFYEDIHDRAGN